MNRIVFNLEHVGALHAAFAAWAATLGYRLPARAESTARPRPRPAFVSAIIAGLATIDLWFSRATQRRILAEFDDQRLQDIGITRAEAEAEIAKPFWR